MPAATFTDLRRARRVLCYGVTGAGKSVAAVALGEALGVPVHLVDEEFGWLPGWRQPSPDEIRRQVAPVAAGQEWVFDSAYGVFRDLVEPQADVVVGLDYPRWVSLSRLLRRTVSRVRTKREVCNGNVETWRHVFSRDSVLLWHARSFARKRAVMRGWLTRPSGTPILLLRQPWELTQVLADLKRG
ncbi:MAG: adenylate kinase [Propionibacteriaceae bacterium]|nr:adenylate kinase [Propionibacteriaceae bacterium]